MKPIKQYLNKHFSTLTIISALFWIASGVILSLGYIKTPILFEALASISLFLWSATRFGVMTYLSTPKNHVRFVFMAGISSWIFIILIWLIPNTELIPLLGFWILMNGSWRILGYIVLAKEGFTIFKMTIIDTIITVLMSWFFIFDPWQNPTLLGFFAASYVFGLAAIQIYRSIVFKPLEQASEAVHQSRVLLPIFLDKYMPLFFIPLFNEWLLADQRIASNYISHKKYVNQVHIYIHVDENQEPIPELIYMGFRNQLFHYLQIPSSYKGLRLLPCKGVIMVTDESKFHHRFENKQLSTAVMFSINVNEKEANQIQANIKSVLTKGTLTERFHTNRKTKRVIKSFSHQGCRFLTIDHPRFKRYHPLTTSGLILIQSFLKGDVWDQMPMYGLLSSKTFYSFLLQEYDNPHSRVVSKKALTID